MATEDAALNKTIEHLGEASRRVRATRRLMPHRALVVAPHYLRLGTRPSKVLNATEAACREVRRGGEGGPHPVRPAHGLRQDQRARLTVRVQGLRLRGRNETEAQTSIR